MKVLEVLLNRRWILKSRERELYYQVKEALASGGKEVFKRKAGVSGADQSLYD